MYFLQDMNPKYKIQITKNQICHHQIVTNSIFVKGNYVSAKHVLEDYV